jgi:hypothetical protein
MEYIRSIVKSLLLLAIASILGLISNFFFSMLAILIVISMIETILIIMFIVQVFSLYRMIQNEKNSKSETGSVTNGTIELEEKLHSDLHPDFDFIRELEKQIGKVSRINFQGLVSFGAGYVVKNSRVVKLLINRPLENISEFNLPDSICELDQLEELILIKCNLTHLPDNIGKLHHLRNLNIESNKISSLPESFESLDELRELNILGNPLTQNLGKLKKLPHLSKITVGRKFYKDRKKFFQELEQNGVHVRKIL